MRRRVGLGALVVAAALVAFPAPGLAVERAELVGTWMSVDHDGSNQTLSIQGGGSGNFAMFLFDDAATSACGGAPARATGSGRVDGDELVMSATLTCSPGGNFLRSRLVLEFHYDAGTETLTDFSGVVWHRS